MKKPHFLLVPPGVDPASLFPESYVGRIDGARSMSLKAFYHQIADALDFPDYFGRNLDSLDELLNDLQWIDEDKIVLYVANSGPWLSGEPADDQLPLLLDLLEAAAEEWRWLDPEETPDWNKKELRIAIEESPRLRSVLEAQEILFESTDKLPPAPGPVAC